MLRKRRKLGKHNARRDYNKGSLTILVVVTFTKLLKFSKRLIINKLTK